MKKSILVPALLLLAASPLCADSTGIQASNGQTQSTQVSTPNAGTYSVVVFTESGGFAYAGVDSYSVDVYGPYQNNSQSGALASGSHTLSVNTTPGGYASATVSW